MDAIVLHHCVGGIQLCGCDNGSGSHKILGNSSLRFISKGFAADIGFFRKESGNIRANRFNIIRASTSHTSSADEAAISTNATKNSQKSSSEVFYFYFHQLIAYLLYLLLYNIEPHHMLWTTMNN